MEDEKQKEISAITPNKGKNKQEWYVFYVRGKHEKQAERLLTRDGYTSYLPIRTVLKEWSDRKKSVEEPLFKSYIFVYIYKNQIYDVLQLPSIVTYVRFAGEPAIIRQKHIDLIKELILNKTKFDVSNKRLKVGERLKLKSGPFKGQMGVVKQLRGSKKVLVDLETINFTLEIEL